MYNSAGCSPRCQNREVLSDFHLNLFGRATAPQLFLSCGRRTAKLEAFLLCGQFLLPGEKWAEECTEGQSSISKRKTKIMIALTCSWGAVCSLKSSREEVIQWLLILYSCHHARRGSTHTQNKYESKFTFPEAYMLAAMHTNVCGNKETCIRDHCLCQFYFWFIVIRFHILMVYFCLGAFSFFLRFNLLFFLFASVTFSSK